MAVVCVDTYQQPPPQPYRQAWLVITIDVHESHYCTKCIWPDRPRQAEQGHRHRYFTTPFPAPVTRTR